MLLCLIERVKDLDSVVEQERVTAMEMAKVLATVLDLALEMVMELEKDR